LLYRTFMQFSRPSSHARFSLNDRVVFAPIWSKR
jgi:hypothetical protein